MEIPFQPIVERKPNPYGVGMIARRAVDIQTITEEMADPSAAITKRLQDTQPLPVSPVQPGADLQAGYL